MALKQQRGNTLVGFIIGLVVGLTVALGLAIYVTKMPIPFMNKGQARSSDADSAEDKKNKDWDPNAPLYGKHPAKSAVKADGDTKKRVYVQEIDKQVAALLQQVRSSSAARAAASA